MFKNLKNTVPFVNRYFRKFKPGQNFSANAKYHWFQFEACFYCFPHCVVPENIHTPGHVGNWKFRRGGEGGGGQRPRKFQRGGGLYDRVSFQRDSRGPLFDSIRI